MWSMENVKWGEAVLVALFFGIGAVIGAHLVISNDPQTKVLVYTIYAISLAVTMLTFVAMRGYPAKKTKGQELGIFDEIVYIIIFLACGVVLPFVATVLLVSLPRMMKYEKAGLRTSQR